MLNNWGQIFFATRVRHFTLLKFPNFGKKGQPRKVDQNFKTNFRKLSVPFDFEPEFTEILVEWSAPIAMFGACVAGRRRGGKGSRRLVFPLFPVSPFRARLLDIGRLPSGLRCFLVCVSCQGIMGLKVGRRLDSRRHV